MASRGRRPIQERIQIGKMIKAYEYHRTLRSAAKALGITHVTLSRALKDAGIDVRTKDAAMKEAHKKSPHFGTFALWLIENKGKALPRSIEKLMELSGCTRDAVSCYFYRRRKDVKDQLRELPDLRTIKATVADSFGTKYRTDSFVSYEYLIDKYSLKVKVLAKLKDGTVLQFPIQNLGHFVMAVKEISPPRRKRESSSQQGTPSTDHPSEDSPKISEHNAAEDFLAQVPGSSYESPSGQSK